MAIYNLNGGSLESLLHTSFSPGTESAIIDAIKNAGIVDLTSGKIGVEVEKKGGSYSIPNQVQVFLDTGSHNTITIKDHGAELIAAGDGANHIIDNGPGGDTLVGGAGQEFAQSRARGKSADRGKRGEYPYRWGRPRYLGRWRLK